jgi:hypothetical protein
MSLAVNNTYVHGKLKLYDNENISSWNIENIGSLTRDLYFVFEESGIIDDGDVGGGNIGDDNEHKEIGGLV